jgi:hypothetical protein
VRDTNAIFAVTPPPWSCRANEIYLQALVVLICRLGFEEFAASSFLVTPEFCKQSSLFEEIIDSKTFQYQSAEAVTYKETSHRPNKLLASVFYRDI